MNEVAFLVATEVGPEETENYEDGELHHSWVTTRELGMVSTHKEPLNSHVYVPTSLSVQLCLWGTSTMKLTAPPGGSLLLLSLT